MRCLIRGDIEGTVSIEITYECPGCGKEEVVSSIAYDDISEGIDGMVENLTEDGWGYAIVEDTEAVFCNSCVKEGRQP